MTYKCTTVCMNPYLLNSSCLFLSFNSDI
jgi:hypothetical protein